MPDPLADWFGGSRPRDRHPPREALGDLAALEADRDQIARAERTLQEAEAELGPETGSRAVLEIHRTQLDIARARQAVDPEDRLRYRRLASERIAEACRLDGERCRTAAQLAERALEEQG